MLQKSTKPNNLQVKEHLSPLLLMLGDIVVMERVNDDYFLVKDCGIYMGSEYTQVTTNTAKTERNAHIQNNSALRCTI